MAPRVCSSKNLGSTALGRVVRSTSFALTLSVAWAVASEAQDSLPPTGLYDAGIVVGWEHTANATNPYAVRPFGFGAAVLLSRSFGMRWQIGVGGRYGEHYPVLETTRFAGWFAELRYYWRPRRLRRVPEAGEFLGLRTGYMHVWGPISGARGGGLEIAPTGGTRISLSPRVRLELVGSVLLQWVDGAFGSQFGVYVGSVFSFGSKGGGT